MFLVVSSNERCRSFCHSSSEEHTVVMICVTLALPHSHSLQLQLLKCWEMLEVFWVTVPLSCHADIDLCSHLVLSPLTLQTLTENCEFLFEQMSRQAENVLLSSRRLFAAAAANSRKR